MPQPLQVPLSIPDLRLSRFAQLSLALVLAGVVHAQGVRVAPPAGVAVATPELVPKGVPVELFENPTIDRYLRRAESFLQSEDFASAIGVLQDVIEGRTRVEVGGAAEPAAGLGARQETSDRYAVFAADGRLYRPVRRLAQELLAKLPPPGLALYRTLHEADAAKALAAALAAPDLSGLQAVVDRFFASEAAGQALALLADRGLSEGRYRTAAYYLRQLLQGYPAALRATLGLSDAWLQFKLALCLAMAGDRAGSQQVLAELRAQHGSATLRIAGELQTAAQLANLPVFLAEPSAAADEAAPGLWLAGQAMDLVPVWQYRFANGEPYQDPTNRPRGGSIVVNDHRGHSNAMPFAGRYFPGTHIALLDPEGPHAQVAFLEHYKVRIADVATGLMQREGDGPAVPQAARDHYPRARIAACDFALLHAVASAQSLYAVLGYTRKLMASTQVLRETELVAYERSTLRRQWSSEQWLEGERNLRDTTLLAAPTPFLDRLLVPALRDNRYSLECLEAASGKPLWSVPLHAGGTEFFKAPGVRVAMDGALAYVATNAGCVAAVDAWSAELLWIRKYEREDALRPSAAGSVSATNSLADRSFAQLELNGFYPSELLVGGGMVIVAPLDGDMLLGLDGATGAPLWLFDAATRYAPFGRLRDILGATGDALYLCSDSHLVCLSRKGGLVRWARELPIDGETGLMGRGRGAVIDGWIVVPGHRELLVFDAAGKQPMQRLPVPGFGVGREPLAGSYFVQGQGAWLALGYSGGVEVLSTRAALARLANAAADPFAKANLYQRAEALPQAEATLAAVLDDPTADQAQRQRAERSLLTLARAQAMLLAARDLDAALRVLEARKPATTSRELLLQWHLARLDCAQAAGATARYSEEQERLYRAMEGS